MSPLKFTHIARSLSILILTFLAACASDGGFQAGSTLRSIDNDTLSRSDDQYTSGLVVSYVSKPADSFAGTPLPAPAAGLLDKRWPFQDEDQHFVIYSLSHRSFTPTDLHSNEIVQDDLPYSALLYGTAAIGTQNHNSMNALVMSLGVVGPLALGKELQSSYHGMIGSAEPAGWDHQLENEPLINFGFDSRRRLLRVGSSDGFGGDLLSGASASLGNLQSQGSLATTIRLGYGVPSNFHMQAPFLAEEALGVRSHDSTSCGWSFYGFAGAAATLLGNAIYLDGNTFADSHSVDHSNYVLRSSIGVALRYKKFLINLSVETATVPWEHPEGLDIERYGRIGVSWDL